MDAHALLKSQGWRGTGHSLHKSDDSIGLSKPILTSRKNNTLGIGRKNHVTSDQWWLNALDEQLKSLDTSSKTSIVQTKKNTKLEGLLTAGAGKYTGANALYACFVSGGLLQGTLHIENTDQSTDSTPEAEVPAPVVKKETKEERRARREERRRKKAAKLAKENIVAADEIEKESVKSKPKSRSKSKSKSKTEKKTTSGKQSSAPETKEERRARKEAKRKEKAKKAKHQKVEAG